MPLASSLAAPRLVAALLLMIDFVAARRCCRMRGGTPTARRPRSCRRRAGRRAGRDLAADPARSRDHALDHLRLRRRAVVAVAAVGLALSRRGSCRAFASASARCPASAAGWHKPAGRRSSAIGSAGRSPPISRAPTFMLFFGASDFFSMVSYAATGLITSMRSCFSLLVGPIYGDRHRLRLPRCSAAPATRFSAAICYGLIALAVIVRTAGARRCLALANLPSTIYRRTAADASRRAPTLLLGARAGACAGSVSFSAPILRSAASAARSPLSQAPSTVPHSVSWVASPARNIAADRLGQNFSRALAARRCRRHRAQHVRRRVPACRARFLDCRRDLAAEQFRQPFPGKGHHGGLALGRQVAAERAARHRSSTATSRRYWRAAARSGSNCSARS